MDYKKSVIYEIYPKSFCDTSGNGFGDLNGITSKLDYLQTLGVNMLWLCPFFVSPQVDNGYDVADYYAVDPRYGTMEDFDNLVREADRRGIGLMLDMVFNHTSDQHVWFRKALAGDPYYRDFYIFRKGGPDHTPPTNWQSRFGRQRVGIPAPTGRILPATCMPCSSPTSTGKTRRCGRNCKRSSGSGWTRVSRASASM